MHIETLTCPICGEVLENYYENENNYFFCSTCNLNFDIYPAIHKEYWYMECAGRKAKFVLGKEKPSLMIFRTKETAKRFIQDYIRDSGTKLISLDNITFCPIDHFPEDAIDASDKYIKFNDGSESLEDLPYVSR